MNEEFKSYVTSTAFRLDLTHRMTALLCRALKGEEIRSDMYGFAGLERRGLVVAIRGGDKSWLSSHPGALTEAGKLVAKLCDMVRIEE